MCKRLQDSSFLLSCLSPPTDREGNSTGSGPENESGSHIVSLTEELERAVEAADYARAHDLQEQIRLFIVK